MFITKIVNGANASNIRIETPIKNLEFHIYADGLASPTVSALMTKLDPVHCEVVKQTRQGSVTVLQKTKLFHLFEIATVNGGLINGELTATTGTLQSCIELSDFGEIPLSDGEFFEVNFTGAAGIGEISLYAMGDKDTASLHNVYERIYVNANSPRDIDVSSVKAVHFGALTFDKIELEYPNGKRLQLDVKEVRAIMRDSLEMRTVIRKYVGAGNEAEESTLVNWQMNDIIPVFEAKTLRIYATNSESILTLKYADL